MSLKWAFKDPDEVLDYDIDWSLRLGDTDTISTSTFTVPSGLTKDSNSHTDTLATVWLSSGTAGETYDVLNRITTAEGRTMDQTVKLPVKNR